MKLLAPAFAAVAAAGCAASSNAPPGQNAPAATVFATAETTPAPSDGDAADDAAVWINPVDPLRSLILGTDKQSGLHVYALNGATIASLPIGRLNNVDLRPGGAAFDYAVATHRGPNTVAVFRIAKADGAVEYAGAFPTGAVEPYGICAAGDQVFVTYKDGLIQSFRVNDPAPGTPVAAKLVSTAKRSSQLEGCVADATHDRLFVGEERRGVWALRISDLDAPPVLVDTVARGGGLVADVEGLSLWRGAAGEGWLVVSAQGANQFAVYDRKPPFAPRGVFQIGGSDAIDGVQETDGVEVVSTPIPPIFPRGVLVVQDGLNTDPPERQNFKIVNWGVVEVALGLPHLEHGE